MALPLLDITRGSILAPLGLGQFTNTFLFEIIDMIIMSLAIGYIFSGYLKKPAIDNYDPLKHYKSEKWENIKFAAMAAGPAVVLHELAHKFVAMGFGAQATLFAPYGFYILVIVLKAIGFPFLFFVGGFVVHSGLPPLQSAIVSIAGPLTNFLIWGIIKISIKKGLISRKYLPIAVPLGKISIFLAIFNLIPLPGFDGGNFISSIMKAF